MCLGGFRNIRGDYDYEGLKLELDETIYEWGTCFEIEVETVRVSAGSAGPVSRLSAAHLRQSALSCKDLSRV